MLPLQLQVGVEFEASTRMQDTSVSFGYQLDLPKANLLFKGADSAWGQLGSGAGAGAPHPPGQQARPISTLVLSSFAQRGPA